MLTWKYQSDCHKVVIEICIVKLRSLKWCQQSKVGIIYNSEDEHPIKKAINITKYVKKKKSCETEGCYKIMTN